MKAYIVLLSLSLGFGSFGCKKKNKSTASDSSEVATESPGEAGTLNVSFETAASFEGGPQTYALANGIDVPSTAVAFDESLPSTMQAGTIAVGSNLLADDGTYNYIAPPIDIASYVPDSQLGEDPDPATPKEKFFKHFLGGCRDVSSSWTSGDDALNSACKNSITNETYGTDYAYSGAWSRYFQGSGPTDIRHYLEQADEAFQEIESQYNAGRLRCLSGSHHNFEITLESGDADFKTGVDFPLSCYNDDGSYQVARGYKDSFFYYWQTGSGVNQFVKVKDDGADLEVWNVFGNEGLSGSSGVNHFKSVTNSDGSKDFYMNPMGYGMGHSCGTYMAFHTPPSGSSDTPLMYFYLKYPPPGNPVDCGSGSSTFIELCLDDNFEFANAGDSADLSACTAANLSKAKAPFSLLEEGNPTVSIKLPDGYTGGAGTSPYAAYATTFGDSYTNADGKRLTDLWPITIQDPLKVITERIFEGSGKIKSLVAEMVSDLEATKSLVSDGSRQCLYDIPMSFDSGSAVDKEFQSLLVSCSNESASFGYANDTWSVFRSYSSGGNSTLLSYNVDSAGADIWKMRVAGDKEAEADFSATSQGLSLFHVKVDNDQSSTEFSVMGSKSELNGAYCGVHVRMSGEYLYAKGRFTEQACTTTFLDEDCMKLQDDGKYFRVAVDECFSAENAEVTAFSLNSLDHSFLSIDEFATLAEVSNSELTPADVELAEDSERAVQAVTESDWQLVSNLPLTSTNKAFLNSAKDNGPISANCQYNPADQAKNISFTWELAISELNEEELAALNQAIAGGRAFVGYNAVVAESSLGGATVSQAVSGAAALLDAEGAEIRTASLADHPGAGAYSINNLFEEELTGSESIRIDWAGKLTIDCPDTSNSGDQGSIRFFVKDLKLRM